MEAFLLLLALGALGVVISVVVLLVRVAQLRTTVAHLERRLEHVEGRARAIGSPPATAREETRLDAPAPAEAATVLEDVPPPRPTARDTAGEPAQVAGAATRIEDPATEIAEQGIAGTKTLAPADTPPPRPNAPAHAGAAASTPEQSFDWERLLGVRGAAIVGGIALVLAGLFFVRVAIERGWLGPAARDLLSVGVGVLGLALHVPLRRKGLNALADSIGGAGSVLVYGGAWAAARLHGLVEVPVALSVMTLTTGATLLLAVRSGAPLVAGFALVGGFATPLLLDTVRGASIGLLVYTVVLDGALIAFARVRGWRGVYPLAAVGTALLQATWSLQADTDAVERLVALGLLPLGFALASFAVRDPDKDERSVSVGLGLLVACFTPFALHAADAIGGFDRPHVVAPTWLALGTLLLLFLGTHVADRRARLRLFGVFGALLVPLGVAVETARTIELVGEPAGWGTWQNGLLASAALAAVLGARRHWRPMSIALGVVATPLSLMFALGVAVEPPAFATMAGLLSALLLFGASGMRFPGVWGGLAGFLVGGATTYFLGATTPWTEGWNEPLAWGGAGLCLVAACLGRALGASRPEGAALNGFAATVALPVLVALLDTRPESGPLLLAAGVSLAAACALAVRRTAGVRSLFTLGTLSLTGGLFVGQGPAGPELAASWVMLANPWPALAGLVLAPLIVALFLTRTSPSRAAFAATLAVFPAILVPLGTAQAAAAHQGGIGGWYTAVLAAGAGLIALGAGRLLIGRRGVHVGSVLIGAGGALSLLAFSRWVGTEWTSVGGALAFAWVTACALRARVWGLGIAGLLATLCSAGLLVGATFLQDAFLVDPRFVPVELTVDFGLCAMALWTVLFAIRRAGPHAHRAESDPRSFTGVLAAALVLLAFAWTNAAVFNHYAPEGTLRVTFERMQARDLTLSLAWATFAGGLLLFGLLRGSMGMRWASLALLVTTIFKVFVHDLGSLTGLSRVASLLGLSLTLMAVSLAYSRLLKSPGEQAGEEPEPPEGASAGLGGS